MSKMDGGVAFPFNERSHDGTHYYSHPGASLRDVFAGKALAAAIAAGHDEEMRGHEGWRDELAREAYRYADSMIRARSTATGEVG